jgi:hypothetical protein
MWLTRRLAGSDVREEFSPIDCEDIVARIVPAFEGASAF